MAITFVAAITGGRSVAYPTGCVTGDIIIGLAGKPATTALAVPAEFGTELATINTDNQRSTLVWRKFTNGDTAPTWAVNTAVIYIAFRGANQADPIGDFGSASGTSTTVSFPARTMQDSSGSSWVAGLFLMENTDADFTVAPSGMTHRDGANGAAQSGGSHDTNVGVTSWSAQTAAVGGTSAGWHGWTVEVLVARSIDIDAGSYALTGTNASLQIGRMVSADAGSYTLTGTDASLQRGLLVAADAGSYVLSGADAELSILAAGDYQVNAESGSYSLSGTDAELAIGREVTAEAGSYELSGADATLAVGQAATEPAPSPPSTVFFTPPSPPRHVPFPARARVNVYEQPDTCEAIATIENDFVGMDNDFLMMAA
jgi:hypothetical protein